MAKQSILFLLFFTFTPFYAPAYGEEYSPDTKNEIILRTGYSNMARQCGEFKVGESPSSNDLFTMYEARHRHFKEAPLFSIEYNRVISKLFRVGINVDYSFAHASLIDPVSKGCLSHKNVHGVSITPSLKYSYLRGEIISVYSGIGAGVLLLLGRDGGVTTRPAAPFTMYLVPVAVEFELSPVCLSIQSFYGRCRTGEYGGVKAGCAFRF